MGELPPEPELQYRERSGHYGELVRELTPESEQRWAEYLRELHFAKAALIRNKEEGKR